MCSNGARVNTAMHWVVKKQIGNHYMLVLCPNHKIKLAIHGAFDLSNLNTLPETNLTNVYYLFRQANLWWRLFKQQAMFQVSFINYFFSKNQHHTIFILSFVLLEPCLFFFNSSYFVVLVFIFSHVSQYCKILFLKRENIIFLEKLYCYYIYVQVLFHRQWDLDTNLTDVYLDFLYILLCQSRL